MKFSNYCRKLMLEHVEYKDLPDTMAGIYGFWISPDGLIDIAHSMYDHAPVAKEIVLDSRGMTVEFINHEGLKLGDLEIKRKLQEYDGYRYRDFLMEEKRYVRVAKDSGKGNVLFTSGPLDRIYSKKQIATLKDIGMLYNKDVLADTGKPIYMRERSED